MIGFLRVPSFSAFSCVSMYAAFCAARFGIVSLTLTPATPWHAAHTVCTLALPASTSAANAFAASIRMAAKLIDAFIGLLLRGRDSTRRASYAACPIRVHPQDGKKSTGQVTTI